MIITDLRHQRPDRPADLAHLLLQCHDRIRTFLSLARAIGERLDSPEEQVVDACHRVERFFILALPLHMLDEEDSLLPRLVGRSADLDDAIQEVQAQHQDHQPQVDALLRASVAVREEPASRTARARLAAATMDLSKLLLSHLASEEAEIFPQIRRWLPPTEQAEIIDELRARRGVTNPHPRASDRRPRQTIPILMRS